MAPRDIPNIKNITITGRIATGATTLATKLGEELNWEVLDGGKLFRKINAEIGASVTDTHKRPDHYDLEYEERIKKMLAHETHHIIQSHLAGYDAQNIPQVFKVLVVCEDNKGDDKTDIRIDRLVNRDGISMEEAKLEIKEREQQNLDKFRRLYANNDPNWVYWDKKYYDLVINTYNHNQDEALQEVLKALHITE